MKKSFRFDYEAHYSLSHEPTFQEKEIWLVLHGYGQLAEFFLRKFGRFFSTDRLFIAPEGTNYTYLEGFQGRVGANWMTRHEQETAIENNHRFLDSLLDSVLSGYVTPPPIHVLGFSQGAATAARWASRWKGEIRTLVLWAGGFALDLSLENTRTKFQNTTVILALGDRDEMITSESIQKQEELIVQLKKEVIRVSYSGGHELDSDVLEKIINHQL